MQPVNNQSVAFDTKKVMCFLLILVIVGRRVLLIPQHKMHTIALITTVSIFDLRNDMKVQVSAKSQPDTD